MGVGTEGTGPTAAFGLLQLLAAGADDAAVCAAYDRLVVSYSMDSAAARLLAAAGAICHVRPHLARHVLARPVDVLVAMGCTDAAGVLKLVGYFLRHPYPQFAEVAGPAGLAWLSAELPALSGLVGELAAESVEWYARQAHPAAEPGAAADGPRL